MLRLTDLEMLRLIDPGLPAQTREGLAAYQNKVDTAGGYPKQVEAGRALFKRYNRKRNRVFKVVRRGLADMCAGARRCCYCEDSAGYEIDHIAPKDLYPERAFVWENYLLACGQCNRGKGARFAVVGRGDLVDVTRRPDAPVVKPLPGAPAPINPRREDPLEFLDLEIVDTFRFLLAENLSAIDGKRARYTIEVLKLNRDVLTKARREAYRAYRALLSEYRELRDTGTGTGELDTWKEEFLSSAHPTVWREMQRQYPLIDELQRLFADVPEALAW